MNPLDAILSALVDSAFPIVKEVPYAQDSISLFRSLNLVVYGGLPKRAGMQAVVDLTYDPRAACGCFAEREPLHYPRNKGCNERRVYQFS